MTRKAVISLLLLLAVMTGGCAFLITEPAEEPVPPVPFDPLAAPQQYQQDGNYTGALDAYRKVLQEHPGSDWAAAAKYAIATIYALADNPQRDYALAMTEFEEFLHLFPQHARVSEAKSWRQLIKLTLDTKKENERLNKSIEQLKQLDMKQEEKRLGR